MIIKEPDGELKFPSQHPTFTENPDGSETADGMCPCGESK